MRMVKTTMLVASTVTASLVAGLAQPSNASVTIDQANSYLIHAGLSVRQQVPAPKDAVGARALLTGKLVLAGKRSSFVWKLTSENLSGRALAANIGVGAPGKEGTVALPLCVRCVANANGSYTGPYVANPSFVRALLQGKLYAFITTRLNPKGEIRGQITARSA